MQKYSPKFHRTIKLAPAIGDWTTIHRRQPEDAIEIYPVRTSNFDSLTRDQLQFLHYLHYRMAERLCLKFSSDMDIKVELHTILATQMSYHEFLETAKDKVVQADVAVFQGQKINLLFDWDLADMMINRLVGGSGNLGQSDVFTSMETSILKAQISTLLPEVAHTWHTVFPEGSAIEFSVGQYRRNPKISSREAYVQFGFYLVFGQQELRKFVIAYPNTVLRALVQEWQQNNPPKEKKVFFSEKTLNTLKTQLSVSLGTAVLTMAELRQLRVGDVIVLDGMTDKPLPIQLGGEGDCLWGYPGVSHNRKLSVVLHRPETEVSVSPIEKKKADQPVTPSSVRQPLEVPSYVQAGSVDVPTFSAPRSEAPPLPRNNAATMVGAAALAAVPAAVGVVSAQDEDESEEGFSLHNTVVDDDEFEIEDELTYEDADDEAQTEEDAEDAFDFSEDETLQDNVHADTDDSEFSWDDLDDEL